MDERRLSILLHTRGFTFVMMVAAVVTSIVAYNDNAIIPFDGNHGYIFPSANEWLSGRGFSLFINLLVTFGLGMTAGYILKVFNPTRALSSMWASFFILMQLALPSVIGQFYSGTFLAVVLMLATIILFTCFGVPDCKRIFLAFVFVSVGSMFQYGFLFFIPVMLAGMIQMRVFYLQPLLAAVLGIVAPYWFVIGCGIVPFDSIFHPQFVAFVPNIDDVETIRALAFIVITIFFGIGFLIANLMKMLAYNAQVRALNGFMAVMLVATALMIPIDYANCITYIPLLNLLSAYQVCFFFSIRRYKRSYIPVMVLIGIYLSLYIWAIA